MRILEVGTGAWSNDDDDDGINDGQFERWLVGLALAIYSIAGMVLLFLLLSHYHLLYLQSVYVVQYSPIEWYLRSWILLFVQIITYRLITFLYQIRLSLALSFIQKTPFSTFWWPHRASCGCASSWRCAVERTSSTVRQWLFHNALINALYPTSSHPLFSFSLLLCYRTNAETQDIVSESILYHSLIIWAGIKLVESFSIYHLRYLILSTTAGTLERSFTDNARCTMDCPPVDGGAERAYKVALYEIGFCWYRIC